MLKLLQKQINILSVRLDTAYFAKNWKFIAKNTVTKYFLLLQITLHPFLALGWSMNSATDQPKKKKNARKQMQTQTLETNAT